MIKFPKIGQFRDAIRNVAVAASFKGLDDEGQPIYDESVTKPTLPFRGTVKLHGSNGAIVMAPGEPYMMVQSRNRVLTLKNDNAGFAHFVLATTGGSVWLKLAKDILGSKFTTWNDNPIVIYGEWCGGNIQPSVALAELPKMFVVFGLRVGNGDTCQWIDIKPYGSLNLDEQLIFSIYDERFPSYEVEIDFENPLLAQNKMIEITDAVEKECPVAKGLGVSGVGEGVVWTCTDPTYNDSGYWFKVKGEKHSVTKVKTLAPIDTEKVKSVKEFVERTVTENRCLQGIEFLKEQGAEVSKRSTGNYIKWVTGDIVSEELDTMVESSLDHKAIAGPVSNAARKWFFNYLNAQAGL